MKLNKMNIDHFVGKILKEMAMDLPPGNEPHPDVTGQLARDETPYSSEHLPQSGQENMNFQELLASDRYKQVIQKLQEYTGMDISLHGMEGYMPILTMVQTVLKNILQTEAEHREELERLGVDLVMKEMGIPEGSFIFDAKIVGLGEEELAQPQKPPQEPEQDEINIEGEQDLMNRIANLDLEKAKRRLINSMVQGAAKRGHYMFHYVSDKIAEITGSDTLVNEYGVLMAINDSTYWQASDESINMMMGTPGAQAGQEEVDRNTEPPTIKVRAAMFPVLVHELIKGVMEIFAIQGMPEVGAREIMSSEDTPEKEIWDLRLGPSIWDRVRSQFPEEILIDENQKELQNYLLVAIFRLEARQFLVFMKEVLIGSEVGKSFIVELMKGVRKAFNGEDYTEDTQILQNNINDASDDIDDDELNDFLGSLGIGPAGQN
jgi:hypothetical protein